MNNEINVRHKKRLITGSILILAFRRWSRKCGEHTFGLAIKRHLSRAWSADRYKRRWQERALGVFGGANPRFGKVTYHGVGEFADTTMPSMCANGNPGAEQKLIAGAIVVRLENGDLIRSRADSGAACFDVITRNTIFVTFNTTIIGGTGQFAGATGNLTTRATATIVVGDPSKGQSFGSVVASSKGRIVTK